MFSCFIDVITEKGVMSYNYPFAFSQIEIKLLYFLFGPDLKAACPGAFCHFSVDRNGDTRWGSRGRDTGCFFYWSPKKSLSMELALPPNI